MPKCPQCDVPLDSKNERDHLETMCPKGLVACPLGCGSKFPRMALHERISHFRVCPSWKIACPYTGEAIFRSKWESHSKTCKSGMSSAEIKNLKMDIKGVGKSDETAPDNKSVEVKEKKNGEKRIDVCYDCGGRILSYDVHKTICLGCFEKKLRLERKRDAVFAALQNPRAAAANVGDVPPWELMAGMTPEELRERLDKMGTNIGGSGGLGGLTGLTNQGSNPPSNPTEGPRPRRASADMSPDELRAMLAQVAHDSLIYKDSAAADEIGMPVSPTQGTEGPTPSSCPIGDENSNMADENGNLVDGSEGNEEINPLARACADFEGSAENGTLSFQTGDVLEIIDMVSTIQVGLVYI